MTIGAEHACACGAVLCAAAAVWLAVGGLAGSRRAQALFQPMTGIGRDQIGRHGVRVRAGSIARCCARLRERGAAVGREWLCLPVAAVLAVLGASVLPLALGACGVPVVRKALRARSERLATERRAAGVIDLCSTTAGELKAGIQPAQALAAAASATRGLGDAEVAVLAAVRFGGDVPQALRQAGRAQGADGLVGLAACWRVAVDGGAGLAAGLDRLETALRAERDQREGLRAQLAGAWSTVTVLALLPAVGLGLGAAMGADPLRVLLHTTAGAMCLVAGGVLEGVGLWWARRIVRAGEAA